MKKGNTTDFAILREKAGWSVLDTASHFGVSPRTIYRWDAGESSPDPIATKELSFVAERSTMGYVKDPSFKFIDLFAGIGGLRRAFESVGGQCVFTSEWDEACRKTYQENFSCNHEVAGDIRDVDHNSVPEYDVLVAGFPCQPFSIAGVSKNNALGRPHGFQSDTQGTLFFDVAQMIEYHRPVAFLLENVKNLLSHDKGRTFAVIRRTLETELQYHIDVKVVDGRSWVPQHRERIFIVGFRDIDFSFDQMNIPDPLLGPRLASILHPEDGSELAELPYTHGEMAEVASKYTLSEKLWDYLQAYAAKHKAKGNGFGFGLFGPDDVARTLSARYYKDGSEILIRQEGTRPRRLTPRECARLMGFDRPGHPPFKITVSDTQAYKQFGNSVAVPAVEHIVAYMLPYILHATRNDSNGPVTQSHGLFIKHPNLELAKYSDHRSS